jgi:two-component system copper resistance phosphate regulon response regulator CusR
MPTRRVEAELGQVRMRCQAHRALEQANELKRGEADLINLKPREYQLLEYLARRSGDVVSQSEIEAHLYDDSSEVASNVVESTISSLRRKLAEKHSSPLIHTRRGLGYVMEIQQP